MSEAELRLRQDLAARERARKAFTKQLTRVKDDLDAKGVGARAKETVVEETREVAETGLDVARERKGVIAGTIVALLLWVFRDPLTRQVRNLIAWLGAD